MLSGLLTAYSLFGRLQRGQPIRIFQEYVGRLFRIVPTLGALILFCTYILPLLGSGPQWNLVVTHHSDICKTYWWRNLMFIHNYFGFENMVSFFFVVFLIDDFYQCFYCYAVMLMQIFMVKFFFFVLKFR